MRILLSNDDGFGAPGIQSLVKVLSESHEIYVVVWGCSNMAAYLNNLGLF